ncbi:YcnI family copper-binding membrane protein [Microterricola viridarii]|uniref:Uncharacterized protein YcnI n=1 Tax=Microterricola viridarii TaxID=412690 RepID=A0A1H1P4H8_9MICO|nr:YcnI family protein [Microterricola viridarii]SDS06094.1 Uncharacterized protein YcnI [Microterricola viridarii]
MTSRTRSTRTLAFAGLAAGALLAVGAPLAASAHVGVTPSDTAAGSYSLLTFSVGHGCDGAATTRIAIDIPESIVSVTPTVNPNWTIEKVKTGDGDAARTSQVVYTAIAPLEDGLRDTFVLSAKLPAEAAGDTLEFPVLQTCTVGETNWNETTVAGEAEPDAPAPAFTLTEASAEGDGHGHGGATTESTSGDASATAAGDSSVAPAAPSADIVARVLGVVGLVVGAVGIALAVITRRSAASK